MKPEDHNPDERQMATWLEAVDADAPPPDEEFLARLAERSAEVFQAESSPSPSPQLPARKRRMFVIAMRTLAATAAAGIIAVTLFFTGKATDDSATALGSVLDKFAAVSSLRLEITVDDRTETIWAAQPGVLRWDHTDGTYRIARGDRMWLVDEKANRAASAKSPYFGGEKHSALKPLALLGTKLAELADDETLAKSQPVEKVEHDGETCHLYRTQLAAAEGKILLEALVNTESLALCRLEAKWDRNGLVKPIGTIDVVARDEPIDESLFVVGDTLTEDGRVGKVTDAQGITSVKPVMSSRFTPASTGMLVKPGDWLRTDVRGANALAVRLAGNTKLTLGPGTRVEVVRPDQIRVSMGQLEIVAEGKRALQVEGPGGQELAVKGTRFYRLVDEKFALIEKGDYPLWLQGFEGATTNESLGSLLAEVNGVNVPLSVGDHQVTVNIRDQIAQTVIEETFVNHTDVRTEGIFYFPLPQDASISGFGMWIDGKLVEADVVEKQRAREIYETILRERRDPGLLEWTGGNIFKARVFPIFANSRKRIKIVYTQVLPLKGNQYRYSYGLRSEMLKQKPLDTLNIDVRVHSALPLASVTSPTHLSRIAATENAGHVEFSAQEYAPTRDFEVVVELASQQSDVVVIPHERGDEGYFMMMLTPPAGDGLWQREVLPDGDPLRLLVLADTSASMDATTRRLQAELIASLLGSLTPEDKINLATCDVDCRWAFKEPMPADTKQIEAARELLAERTSLGWTDLDKAFSSAFEQCETATHVIYIGDGMVTTGDADPVAFGKRLRRLGEGRPGTFHAVTVGNAFEPVVLKTIASLGGGSIRQVGGELTPQIAARQLLAEIAQPGIRDLKVEFPGLTMVRVYPEELPNLPVGSQQILLGKYFPNGRDQQGEVVVTGTQNGKPVQFRNRVVLQDKAESNSFLPRLWARRHLDALLEQGATSLIKEEIIGLSEEYNIITPYTSLLVLESDADRERFGVKRRFRMCDGEEFWDEGRRIANFELLQQQMRLAGNWRLGLRRTVLGELIGLGRNVEFVSPQSVEASTLLTRVYDVSRFATPMSAATTRSYAYRRLGITSGGTAGAWSVNGRDDAWYFNDNARGNLLVEELQRLNIVDLEQSFGEGGVELGGKLSLDDMLDVDEDWISAGESTAKRLPSLGSGLMLRQRRYAADYADFRRGEGRSRGLALGEQERVFTGLFSADLQAPLLHEKRERYGRPTRPQQSSPWVATLFPYLPPPTEGPAAKPKQPWPADARALAESLLRTEQLAALSGGLQVQRRVDGFDARFGDLASRSQTLNLVSPTAWLILAQGAGSQHTVRWCDERERGVFSKAFGLGRLRESIEADLGKPPLDFSGYCLKSIERTYQTYTTELKPQGDGRTLLVLTHPTDPQSQVHVLVDTERHVILSIEHRNEGRRTVAQRFEDFTEVAGGWWAGRIEHTDAEGRRTTLVIQEFKSLTEDAFAKRIERELADRGRVQFLQEPAISVLDAKQAEADGKARFDDHFTLLLHSAATQQWDPVLERLEQLESLAADKPGMRWVRNAVLNAARRREELRTRLMEEAAALAKLSSGDYFLTEYVRSQASGVFGANEMLELLDVLRPVYERQPAHLHAMKTFKQQRMNYLANTGQHDLAMALRKQLAEECPRDHNLQRDYAQQLVNSGDFETAYAWLDGVLTDEARWLEHEEESLRSRYAGFLRQQGRYVDLAEFLRKWTLRNPEDLTSYHQYLSALIYTDRVDEANRLAARWLDDARGEGPIEGDVRGRLDAAALHGLGSIYGLHTERIDERWLQPLADTALFLARHEGGGSIADRIMGNHRFRNTDACRRVRKAAAKILVAELDQLEPAEIQRLVNWISPNDPAVEKPVWQQIADGLKRRWVAETDEQVKNQLLRPLIYSLRYHVGAEPWLELLRLRIREDECQEAYAQLFTAVLEQPWSAEFEDEAFGLLRKQSFDAEETQRLAIEVTALYQLTDRMVRARFDHRMKQIEHPEDETRTDLRDARKENVRTARQEFAKRLRKEATKHSDQFGQWLQAERLYLDVLLGDDLKRIAAECWVVLGDEPPKPVKADDVDDDPARRAELWLDGVLRHRHLVTLANLAVRKDAEPASIDRLLAYLDAGIKADEEAAAESEADRANPRWKRAKYQLLVALDRAEALEKALRDWILPKDADNQWRLALGYILAEGGKILPAIEQFEAVEADDELGPEQYRALADWYMVVDRPEDYRRARIASYKFMDEWRLSNYLSNKLRPWHDRDGQLPGELEEDVLLVFGALLEKSSRPQGHLGQLRQFYQATHDFRLLEHLPDGVVGHTAERVYPFLQGMASVLSEVRDEATVDRIAQRLVEVRKKAETPIDHRAVDLLELLVERRAAEVENQPGPHVHNALTAMQRAFKREWSSGEPRRMADLLAGLGAISQAELADEQVRELEVLHGDAEAGSVDRLHIGRSLAAVRWAYSQHDRAIELLEAALGEYETARGGVLPTDARDTLDTLIRYLEDQRHYARGEAVLKQQLPRSVHLQQTHWLTERLDRLYQSALDHDGDVSLGSKETLYKALTQRIRGRLKTGDHNHRYTLVQRLCSVYRVAHLKRYPTAVDDLKAFAFEELPEVLKLQTSNYQSMVKQVAQTLYKEAGPRASLTFLVERIEQEPGWLLLANDDGWRHHYWQLAYWRHLIKDRGGLLGELEPRLLAIVTAELRRDLESRRYRYRRIYWRHRSYFWHEKEDAFAAVAEEVYAERKQSGAAVRHIAEYLFDGLDHYDRAIEMLAAAHEEKLLDEGGQATLVNFLQKRERHAEAAPILRPLVEWRPDTIDYRVRLMRACFGIGHKEELAAVRLRADEHFHQGDRWNEGVLAEMAKACLDTELFQLSVDYYRELIALHESTQPNRGIGNGTLSEYYTFKARAHAGLNDTPGAVAAASGAVISWGPEHEKRREALNALKQVLLDAPDLDAYVAEVDLQAEKDKQQNAILRKALGKVYFENQRYDDAVRQFEIAREVQPNDAETHKKLVECYDRREDKEGAVRQVLASIELSRRDIEQYKDLARRLTDLGRGQEAERANTSIVEMLPSESESHTALAVIRQDQDRYDEAIAHWQRVAEIRALEPTGLLGLAAAQIHQKHWDQAEDSLRKLDTRNWPARFNTVDEEKKEITVQDQVRRLRAKIKR